MTTTMENNSPNHIIQYTGYLLIALLSVVMLFTAVPKLLGNEQLWQQFVNFGYPYWFYILTGIIEAGAGILLWPRKTRLVGAALIIATMIGALLSNMGVGASQFYAVNIGIAVIAAVVAWLNRDGWPLRR